MSGIIVLREQFIGRADELSALIESYEAAASGRRRIVALTGETGIGKSRLVAELIARLSSHGGKTAWGHCLENLRTPFLPFVDAFRSLGIDTAAELFPDADASGSIGADRQIQRFREMSSILQQAPLRKPYIVVIEDLQWADAATLNFLEYLAFSRSEGPLLVILTMQTEALDRPRGFARSLARMRTSGVITIPLRPLDRMEMIELIRAASPAPIARSSAERVKELAEGNPLFAKELLRAVLDDGQQAITHPAFSSIRTTVLERFYELREDDQRALYCAAVVGRVFDVALVAKLLDLPLVDFLASMRRARNLQLVRDDREGDSQHVAFRHAIFSDVIYRELMHVEARELHSRVAQAIESGPDPERRAGELAYHWGAAGDGAKALKYNVLAAEAAAKLAAYEDAARFYDEAFARVARGSPLHAEIAEKRAYAWYAAGVLECTSERFDEAIAAFAALGDKHKIAEMTFFFSRQAWNEAETPSGYEHAMHAVDLIGDSNPALRDFAFTMAATHAVQMGHPAEAEELLRHVAPTTPEVVARHFDTLGAARCRLGDAAGALDAMCRAREAADQSGEPDAVVRVYSNSADISAVYGDIDAELACWNRAFTAAQEGRYIGRMAYAGLGYALALAQAGELERASDLHGLAIETGVRNASVVIVETCVAALLRALIGRVVASPHSPEDALALAIRSRESLRIGQVGAALAFAAIAEHRAVDARAILKRAVEALETPEFAEILLLLSAVYGNGISQARSREFLQTQASRTSNTVARAAYDTLLAHDRAGSTRSKLLTGAAARWIELRRPLMAAFAHIIGDNASAARELLASTGAHAFAERLAGKESRTSASGGRLTKRELQIASLVAEGRTNRAISDALGISERTVEHHVAAILSRLSVRSRWSVTSQMLEF